MVSSVPVTAAPSSYASSHHSDNCPLVTTLSQTEVRRADLRACPIAVLASVEMPVQCTACSAVPNSPSVLGLGNARGQRAGNRIRSHVNGHGQASAPGVKSHSPKSWALTSATPTCSGNQSPVSTFAIRHRWLGRLKSLAVPGCYL